MRFAELRFDRTSTIGAIKSSLEMKFGIAAMQMNLQLLDTNETHVCDMSDDSVSLGSYGPHEFYTIHVIDTNPEASIINQLDDVSAVEKYTISEDDYNKRNDTFRSFKKKMIAKDPNFMCGGCP